MSAVVLVEPAQLFTLIQTAVTNAVTDALRERDQAAVTWLSVRAGMARYRLSRRQWVALCESGKLRATQRIARGGVRAWYVSQADADAYFLRDSQ
jgi:hypothetical protein